MPISVKLYLQIIRLTEEIVPMLLDLFSIQIVCSESIPIVLSNKYSSRFIHRS